YLERNEPLASYVLPALDGVAGFERNTPLVFLNACEVGRQIPRLLDTGGFPATLLELQAGAVIAPLWSVDDATAFEIASEFYGLAAGDPTVPIAEIVARVRRQAYERPTFVDTYAAYSYFGDPIATLRLM